MLTISEEILTPRLTLRRIQRDDVAAIFAAYSSDPAVARYMTFPVARNVADTQAFVDFAVEAWNRREAFHFLVRLGSQSVIGGCGLERVVPGSDRHFSFGYCFAQNEWNRGYATEVASAFRTWFFSAQGVYRLAAVVDTDNPASARVLEKSGFTCEGILRRWAVHPNVSSEPRDVRIYAAVK